VATGKKNSPVSRKKIRKPAKAPRSKKAAFKPLARGPQKQRAAGGVPVRVSLHKARSVWFRSRAAWPNREANVVHLVAERARLAPQPIVGPPPWSQAGPTNIGGRATALATDPRAPLRVWLGAAGGGVWRSDDGGMTWTSQWDKQPIMNIGALAVDGNNGDVVYCGTGEANLSADSYPGVGLFKTADGGQTWSMIANARVGTVPCRIGAIAVDPFDSSHVLVGGLGYGNLSPANNMGGLYTSTNGGIAWARLGALMAGNYWCHSICFDPSQQGVITVAVSERGARSGLYRSVDGGTTWTQVIAGLPTSDRFGRAALAISPSKPSVMYAIAADAASASGDKILGVFRSADGGQTWANTAGAYFAKEGQMSYGISIAVHPTDPNQVICGGVDLHLTSNGGKSWSRATQWDATRGTPKYAHADHHALLMPSTKPGLIYDANDGGLDVSSDGGVTWTNRSNGLATNMFYDFDVSQVQPTLYGGGAQDNGTLVTQVGQPAQYSEILGGDGGWIVFDPKNAGHLYASFYNFNIYRFNGGAATDVSPKGRPGEAASVWMAYITLDPNNASTVFTGTTRMWRTKDDANTWTPVSADLDGSVISAIEVAPASSSIVYVATENGGFFASADGGTNWSANLAGSLLPGSLISRIETHPENALQVYVTIAGTQHSHIFKSVDGGRTWADIDHGILPDVPYNAILVRPDQPSEIYVACDVGVFFTADEGASWKNISDNLPTVMVTDLVYRVSDRSLYAATYGRSAWVRQLT
jgi:photosystem II stability/assembly factor-like uncharacterized protein